MADPDPNFRYLNLEDRWPQFALTGLRIGEGGALALLPLPSLEGVVGPVLAPAPGPSFDGLAGIDADEDGNLYIAEPGGDRVLRIDGCDGTAAPLPCPGGHGHDPGRLDVPRGILAGPRASLYVADSGNHRVQVVDLRTMQLRGLWGQADPWAPPQPGSGPGELDDPWDLAGDREGFVYVVDHGNHRVQKFDGAGSVLPVFWDTVATQPMVPAEPAYVTVAPLDGGERLVVGDRAGPAVLVFRLDGSLDEPATLAWADLALPGLGGLAVVGGTLFVGDPIGGRVLAFDGLGHRMGEAAGFRGPVAYLSALADGRLLVHPGGGTAVSVLRIGGAWSRAGSFLAGPFSVGERPAAWHHLEMLGPPLPPGSHLRLATLAGEAATPPVWDAGILEGAVAAGPEPTPAGDWRPAPADGRDFLALHPPTRYLWVAGTFEGDGRSTPEIAQMRLTYDHESCLRYLPAIYRVDPSPRNFLERALDLLESFLAGTEEAIGDLLRLFDPEAAPDGPGARPSWLEWLASWLAFDLEESWGEPKRRHALSEAFALYRQRGTVESLRRYIRLYGDATALIDEPARSGGLWSLGESSVLGFGTMLAAGEAQGAVVGTTAVLDGSHLIRDDEYGAPLFEDLAHRFCVRVFEAEVPTPDALARIRAVVEREKPAHTTYHLCLVGARMRVGVQARLGVDAIVGGKPGALVLDDGELGANTVLSDGSGPAPAGVGRFRLA